MENVRVNIKVRGIVQGVGFRPFVHRLVSEASLSGWVRNTSFGAELELEGAADDIDRLILKLKSEPPKLALIESVEVERLRSLKHDHGFRIVSSETLQQRNTMISPDVCVCEDCLREMRDPSNRRYRYPFINCTNCGPRFTIIRDIPYDRPNTTMQSFPMCDDCEKEYRDISDRRYHAEPTACPVCGPRLIYLNANGSKVEGDPIESAVNDLLSGKILAIKGLGGVHLACTLASADRIRSLRERKHRDEKPFAIMCRDAEVAKRFAGISSEEGALLESFRRPILLLEKRPEFCNEEETDPQTIQMRAVLDAVSENGRIGIMLPYTPVHFLLLEDRIDALVMTSANLSDLPIVYQDREAMELLAPIADGFLMNDREIHTRCDDSVAWVVDGKPYFARRSRGYVPYPVVMKEELPPILACGAEQKASFSLSKGTYVFPSQHIGDLKNIQTLEYYEAQIRYFERLFDIRPEYLVCDLHPDYLSTGYAEERAASEGLQLLQVQHHWAHMASCMADNGLGEPCIGIIWDGVGLGPDGTAWGGEFLTGDYRDFRRVGRIRPIRLPGGDLAARELYRTGASMLLDSGIHSCFHISSEQIRQVSRILELGINVPASTGMGRLFDGMSAILGICSRASYEGRGAILLEAAGRARVEKLHAWNASEFVDVDGMTEWDWRFLLRDILEAQQGGEPASLLATAFMDGLIDMAVEMCRKIRRDSGLGTVVCSGGTFQNMYLLKQLQQRLVDEGFRFCHHGRVSTNDEGISLGQLMIAAAKYK